MPATVADAICAALSEQGADVVFGVPGSQTIDLWEALRRTSLRTIVPTSELGAAFMAAGHARASGRVGVLLTIGEPGFAFALPGLAEALLDSVPLLHLVTPARPGADHPSGSFRQRELAGLVAKAVHEPTAPAEVAGAVRDAYDEARSGEPGPVVVHLAPDLLRAPAEQRASGTAPEPEHDESAVDRVVQALSAARRPVLFCGAGVADAAADLVRLAEGLGAPVLTTTTGRGTIPETHRLSLAHDVAGGDLDAVNEVVAQSDVVLVLGAKLSDNAMHHGRLRLPAERLVRVDASADVIRAADPARMQIVGDVPALVRALADRVGAGLEPSSWQPDVLARLRGRVLEAARLPLPEPRLGGAAAGQFFKDLRAVIPSDVPVATDSGLHQYLVRCYLPVLSPRTLLVPSDFQSMGFGIPTAIGAAVATDGPAVAIVGDGGFNINGPELLTAAREGLAVVAVVVVDGQLGLIRAQQLQRTGRAPGAAVLAPDLELTARALGARYLALQDGDPSPLAGALASGGVTVVELPATDTAAFRKAQLRGLAVTAARSLGARTRG